MNKIIALTITLLTVSISQAQICISVDNIKQNIFYVGPNNPVQASVSGIHQDSIILKASQGSHVHITKATHGIYIIKATKPGKCTISVYSKNDTLEIFEGSKTFRIKRIPDPTSTVLHQEGGRISQNKLLAARSVDATLKNFDFDIKFVVKSFTLTYITDTVMSVDTSNTRKFTAVMKSKIKLLESNDRILIDDIKCVGPDGIIRKLKPIVFTID